MKKLMLLALVCLALSLALGITTPRVYVQKLILDNGKNPFITFDEKASANEYILTATIPELPGTFLTTEVNPINSIAVKQVGDGIKMPYTVIAYVQLGNFKQQWISGQTLRLELTHKKSKAKVTWDVYIPEGSALIKMLDTPKVIPPYTKKPCN